MNYAEQRIQTTPHFQCLFDTKHPDYNKMFKVFRGGRGGMKTWQVGRSLLMKGSYHKEKHLCGREYQNSMADSVQALMKDQSQQLGLDNFYTHTDSATTGANGTEMMYKGLKNNINSLKSLEGVKRLWIEEAQTISENTLEVLLPTLRQPQIEVIVTYNPDADDDPIHKFVNSLPPHLAYIAQVNWYDNPWLPESLIIQKDLRLRRIDEATNDEERELEQEAYDRIWLGKCRGTSHSRIFAGKCVQQDFRVERRVNEKGETQYYINDKIAYGPYFGVDWGFSGSPTAACRAWISDECVWIDHELYDYRLDIDKTNPKLNAIPLLNSHIVRADPARPESISYCVRDHIDPVTGLVIPGIKGLTGAEKWPESVEEGIRILRGFKKIIFHTRCTNFYEESRLYSYKVDQKTGDVLRDIVKKFDNLWDSLRYALAPYIKQSGKGQGFYQYYSKLTGIGGQHA
jgi:phage terminase large subunit